MGSLLGRLGDYRVPATITIVAFAGLRSALAAPDRPGVIGTSRYSAGVFFVARCESQEPSPASIAAARYAAEAVRAVVIRGSHNVVEKDFSLGGPVFLPWKSREALLGRLLSGEVGRVKG